MLVNHKDHAYKEIWQLGYGHDSNVYANEILVHGLGKLSSILLFLYMDINSPVKKKSVEHEGMKWDMMLIILGGVEMSYIANDINSFSLRSKEMSWHYLLKIYFVDIRKMIGGRGMNIFSRSNK